MKQFLYSIFAILVLCISNMGRAMTQPIPVDFFYSPLCPTETPFCLGYWLSDEKGEECYAGKNCYSCDYDGLIPIRAGHEKDFERCSNRVTIMGYSVLKKECPPDKPLLTTRGNCVACDELDGRTIQDCSVCPNMEFSKGACHFIECPSDKPMRSKSGGCYSCDTKEIAFFPQEECLKCSDIRWYDRFLCMPRRSFVSSQPLVSYSSNGSDFYLTTYPCSVKKSIETSQEICSECPNRVYKDDLCVLIKSCPQGEMENYRGNCVSCKNPTLIYPLFDDDNSCSNRIMKKLESGENVSVLKQCPNTEPLRDKLGNCFSCEDLGDLETDILKEDCIGCGYIYEQGYCLSKEYPLLEIEEEQNYPCDERDELKTTPENCVLSPNRKYVDGKCVLKNVNK